MAVRLLGLLLAVASPAFAQPGRLGQPPLQDPAWRLLEVRYGLLDADPQLTLEPGRVAVLSFDTRVPTPRAALSCGLLLPGRALRQPQYCRVFREEGSADGVLHHTLRIDLAELESRCGDFLPTLRETRSGTIEALLEVYDPRLQQGAQLPLRFAYRDTVRVPCLSDGPWIDIVDATRAVLSWGTDLPARGTVSWGSVTAAERPAIEFPAGMRHRVELTDLAAGETYHYAIALADSGDASRGSAEGPFEFRVPRPNEDFLFAVINDSQAGTGPGDSRASGVNLRILRTLGRDAIERGAAFIVSCGDMADGQATVAADIRRQWDTWKRGASFIGARLPVYEAIGNHETCRHVYGDSVPRASFDGPAGESVEAMFSAHFAGPANGPPRERPEAPEYGSTVYAFRWGSALFLVLNTTYWTSTAPEVLGGNLAGYVMDGQLAWVEARLREAADDPTVAHVFAAFHMPAFPCDGHRRDAMWHSGGDPALNHGPRGEPIDRSYVLARRDRLWGAFARSGKLRAVFNGHEHNYTRLLVRPTTPVHPDGSAEPGFVHPVWQCIAGGAGGSAYRPGGEVPWAGEVSASAMGHHYLLLGVSGGDVALFAIGETGELIDGVLLAEDGRVSERAITLDAWRARGRR